MTEDAVKGADIVMMPCLMKFKQMYIKISNKLTLKKGHTLDLDTDLAHTHRQIAPRKDINVFMTAPKGPGYMVRRTFTEGTGSAKITNNSSPRSSWKHYGYSSSLGSRSRRSKIRCS